MAKETNLTALNEIAGKCGGEAQASNAKAIKEIAENFPSGSLLFESGTGEESVVQKIATYPNTASGARAFAFGYETTASGDGAFSIGELTEASGKNATATGSQTVASGAGAFSSGTKSSSGNKTTASGVASAAIGQSVEASGACSQAFGQKSIASGSMATAFGNGVTSTGRAATAIGQYNIADNNPIDTSHGSGARKYLFIIGNGGNDNSRSNAMTVDWDGNIVAHNLPEPPTTDGTYTLKCTVSGGVATYAWV